ncbi:MAG: ATP-binding protein, partial [Nanoarchaeota archaeon]|nr:ATP-binding protein [Nanoarchaeota archaeon]
MCGIIGVFDDKDAVSIVQKGLKIIQNRGKDGIGIAGEDWLTHNATKKQSNNCIGHCLHSIVNLVKQPIIGKGKLVANCEIYNWKSLNKDLDAKNDSELLLKLLDNLPIKKALEKLDGVYAFAYWKDDKVYLARDLIGVKPVWYSKKPFAFASEKKALPFDAVELNPREILVYNIKTKKITKLKRKFFSVEPEHLEPLLTIKEKLKQLITDAIEKRIPQRKVGVLFSGGIDSTLIAFMLKKLNVPFTCYTAALEEQGMSKAEDLISAEEVAKEHGFKLKVKKINLKEVEENLKTVVPLIEDSNVTKVGVALTFYAACQLAKDDDVRVIFSGLGSEEIFAGYDRHKKTVHGNKECLSGLLKMYERDTYRDDVITMNSNIELRVPFLDKALVDYALKIPFNYKLNDESKLILRQAAEDLGINHEFAYRKKRAAQYGSKFDRAIEKLAK